MLPNKFRITDKRDFENIQGKGKLSQFESFGIIILRREDKNQSRFAFIVSSKISKDAVDRNRIKRAIRESIRLSLIDLQTGYDVIFLAKPILAKKSTELIMRETGKALKDLGVLKG